jgi:hypothetical protein
VESSNAGEELDPEVYDDTDLYQLLLRDLIESGSTQGGDALVLQNQVRFRVCVVGFYRSV